MPSKTFFIRVGIGIAVLVGWLTLVDKSQHLERCPDCLTDQVFERYRLVGITVYERKAIHNSEIQNTAMDLGVTCSHPKMQHWQIARFWGLIFCYCPCHPGTLGVSSPQAWHDTELRPRLLAYQHDHPEVAEEFRQRVLVERDRDYWKEFLRKVFENKTTNTNKGTPSEPVGETVPFGTN